MSITKEKKAELISEYQSSATDTGSTEVQIAMLTERINNLAEHFKANKKDNNSRRGLLIMIGRRKRFLKYLERKDYEGYKKLIASLGLRR